MVDTEQDPPVTSVRAVRATALGRGTHGVPDLRRLVEGALHTAFPYRTWVAGRVGDVVAEPRVGLHFTLRASTAQDEPFELACLLAEGALPAVADVLDRVHDAEIAELVAEGRLARVGGLLRYDFGRSTLVLQVSELDPLPTARGLQEDREAVRALVREHGLPARQRGRTCRVAPMRVSLVGPEDDAAVARACAALTGAPYALEVRDVPVSLQGREAPAAVADAVREAGLRSDVVLLVRDTGRPLSLAVFDATEVAYAVAQSPVPVVAGLGGGGETTVTDDVAHAALPTGEAAAGWVLGRLADAERALSQLAGDVAEEAERAGERARADLQAARDAALAEAQTARVRAVEARRRLRTRVLAVAAVVAAALLGAAVATGSPLPLLGVAAVAAVLLGAWAWTSWAGSESTISRRSRRMSAQDDDFAAVLAGLRQVRDELAATSSPEAVRRLEATAAQLVAQGERVLGRPLEPSGEAVPV